MTKPSQPGRHASAVKRQRGMSIIELLIGVLVGFIVVAGAVKLMVDTLGSNRRLLLETRVNQDLRTAADLIARDLRRSGYWQNATSGIFSAAGTGTVVSNPYTAINVDTTVNDSKIVYRFAWDNTNVAEGYEWAGFKVEGGILMFRKFGTDLDEADPEQITDPKVITVTNLTITETSRVAELYTFCACLTKVTCTAPQFQVVGGTPGPYYNSRPTLTIRQYGIVLAGQSATDPTVNREIRETVRVRNDVMAGNCPNV